MSSVFLDPSGLDFSGGEDEDCLFKLLFKFSHQFFIDGGQENLSSSVCNEDNNERFILGIGNLLNFADGNGSSNLLAVGIKMVNSFDEGRAYLLFEVGQILQ